MTRINTLSYLILPVLGILLFSKYAYAKEFSIPEDAETLQQHEFYQENGITYNRFTNKRFTGYVIYRYQNGNAQAARAYRNGKLHGKSIIFFRDGSVQVVNHYEDGNLNGPCEGWHQNGQIAFEGQYVDGMQAGLWKEWSPQGELLSRNQYRRIKEGYEPGPPTS